jgi:hypothetical protein
MIGRRFGPEVRYGMDLSAAPPPRQAVGDPRYFVARSGRGQGPEIHPIEPIPSGIADGSCGA